MDSKPSTDQQYRCKTLNCSKSFKNASSLFRHNKCCISFGKSNVNDYQYGGGDQFDPSVGVKVSNETHSSSSSNGIRDAACLCDPGEEEVKIDTMSAPSSRIFTQVIANRLPLDEPINRESRKIKKQVILNPDGEDSAAERYDLDDLAIDENQAAKLESYSCYAGVPQRDKAGLVLVTVERHFRLRNFFSCTQSDVIAISLSIRTLIFSISFGLSLHIFLSPNQFLMQLLSSLPFQPHELFTFCRTILGLGQYF
jgi:hypothetical protein